MAQQSCLGWMHAKTPTRCCTCSCCGIFHAHTWNEKENLNAVTNKSGLLFFAVDLFGHLALLFSFQWNLVFSYYLFNSFPTSAHTFECKAVKRSCTCTLQIHHHRRAAKRASGSHKLPNSICQEALIKPSFTGFDIYGSSLWVIFCLASSNVQKSPCILIFFPLHSPVHCASPHGWMLECFCVSHCLC